MGVESRFHKNSKTVTFLLFCPILLLFRDLNKLVFNYLITEGLIDAAEKFQKETGTTGK
jgi:hypothetical protein